MNINKELEEKAENYRKNVVYDQYDPSYTSYTGKQGYIDGYNQASEHYKAIIEDLKVKK